MIIPLAPERSALFTSRSLIQAAAGVLGTFSKTFAVGLKRGRAGLNSSTAASEASIATLKRFMVRPSELKNCGPAVALLSVLQSPPCLCPESLKGGFIWYFWIL